MNCIEMKNKEDPRAAGGVQDFGSIKTTLRDFRLLYCYFEFESNNRFRRRI